VHLIKGAAGTRGSYLERSAKARRSPSTTTLPSVVTLPFLSPSSPTLYIRKMAPNRPRSNSNAYAHNQRTNTPNNVNRAGYRNQQQLQQHVFQQQIKPQQSPARISTPQRAVQTSTDPGMSPGSRYSQNLKVLRRHDPTIVSIFDQFSHVCLYHHDGVKWEKKGYEGTMFLFER
jgi:hypothetical protein